MSLLKLKSKVEPTYNKNTITNYDNQTAKENKPKPVERKITTKALFLGEA